MHSTAWAELLRLIPSTLRDSLALTTTNGAEIALQSIIRAEQDYLVIKGRVTGTTDGHGVFIIPFDRLNHLTFHKTITEADVRALFDAAPESMVALAPPNKTAAGTPSPADMSLSAPTERARPAEPANRGVEIGARHAGVDKTALLERLRNRRPANSPAQPTSP